MTGALQVRVNEAPEAATSRALARFALAADGSLPGQPHQGPSVTFAQLPFDEAIADFLAREIVTPEEFARMDAAARQRAFTAAGLATDALRDEAYQAILAALEEGTTLREFARELRTGERSLGITPSDPVYLETVFRTNIASAYNAGRLAQMSSPMVLAARPYVQFRAILDGRTTSRCRYCNGLIFNRQTDPGWVRFAPPLHFNCFPGETTLQGNVQAVFRTRYSGQIVKLRTVGGRTLRVTTNHPLLTSDGFIPAGRIHKGQHVLTYVRGVDRALHAGEVQPKDGPATFENVFDALSVGGCLRIGSVSEDLHGDSALGDGYIDVVAADRKLLHHIMSKASEDGRHCILSATLSGLIDELTGGPASNLGIAAYAPSDGRVCGGHLSPLGLHGHSGPFHSLRVGPAANLDVSLYEPSSNNRRSDADFTRQLHDTGAGLISFDEVVHIEIESGRHGASYVYDTQCVGGWQIASGIVSSNCRSTTALLPASRVNQSQVIRSDEVDPRGYPQEGFGGAPSLDLTA